METKSIVLPSGKTATLNAYVTGRVKREMKAALLDGAEITTVGTEATVKGLKANAMADSENVAIKAVVVELDGSKDDIVNRVLDLHIADFDALIAAINVVTDEKDFLGR